MRIRRCVTVLLVICMTAVMAISVSAKIPGAQLVIDGYKEREIISYTYKIFSTTDEEGQAVSVPHYGMITVEVRALKDGNCDLLAWMLARNLPKNGKIQVNDTATGKAIKTITFENAYCVDFKEGMTEDGTHTEIITISCGAMTCGDAGYERDWYNLTGSVFSGGNLWIIIAVAVAAVGGAVAILVVKKRKKPALADGSGKGDEI